MEKEIILIRLGSPQTKYKQNIQSIPESINAGVMEVGKEIGLISFNDAALKQIAANGIANISIDFKNMGQRLAAL